MNNGVSSHHHGSSSGNSNHIGSSEIKPSAEYLMSSISNQLSGYGGIPSGCGSGINGRKLPEGTGSSAGGNSPSGNSSSSFNSPSNMNSNNSMNPSSPHHASSYSSYYPSTSAELAMYGHLNAFSSHHHHRSSHHHVSSMQKPKAKARSNAGKTNKP